MAMNILVAYDGTKEAKEAARLSAKHAKAFAARIVLAYSMVGGPESGGRGSRALMPFGITSTRAIPETSSHSATDRLLATTTSNTSRQRCQRCSCVIKSGQARAGTHPDR